MSEVKKIAHNTLAQIVGKAITICFALVGYGLMTRYLGQQGYGYYATVYSFLAVFGILVDFGLQMTTTQLISNPDHDEQHILSNALTIRLLASIIFLGLAPLIGLFFPYPIEIKIGIAVAAVGFVFSSLISILTSFFQKHLITHQTALAEVLAKIAFVGLVLCTIYTNSGLVGIIGATVADSAISLLIVWYFISRRYKLQLTFSMTTWRLIIERTWPIALTIALNLIYFKGDIIIMSLYRSQAEVGLYAAPYKILEVLINTLYLFLGLILPLLAAAAATQNVERLKKIIQATFDVILIGVVPLIIGGWWLGRPMMVLMAGSDFLISGDIIKILLLATGAIFIAALFGYVVVALNAQKQMIKFYAINAVVSVIGYLVFIPRYTYWGAAWMTVFTEVFVLITAGYIMYQQIHFLPKLTLVPKILLASIIMSIPLYFFSGASVTMLIVLGVVLYGGVLVGINGIDRKVIFEIIQK